VVLIGPLATGKSTVGAALAGLLGVQLCSVDDVRWGYFDQIGYDRAEATRRFAAARRPAEMVAYGQPFEVYAIEQIMATRGSGVIDFGASNSVYDDPALRARVKTALSASRVVLLLPSEDPAASERVLAGRLAAILRAKGEPLSEELLALNSYFVRHPSNRELAHEVVYTHGRRPEAIAAAMEASARAVRA
jgi:predicted kinase